MEETWAGGIPPQIHLLFSKISQCRSPDTWGLHMATRSTLRPFGHERLDLSSTTGLKAEGFSTGYRTRQTDGGQAWGARTRSSS